MALLCQQARDKGGFDKLSPEDFVSSKKKLDDFVHGMQVDKVAQLASAMKKDPNDVDLKNLAKAFLQQHPHAGDELRQPLEKALKAEQSYKSSFQQVKAEEQADLLKPPPNTISLAQQKVEAPQLSVPGSSPTTETSNPSEELECEDDDTEHYSPT
ncbi:hypothetical protein [Legionella sp. km772]|uniref:hypothetical protein n=1 Tax=Legionella sp. km772 TaxID=2498111 RepID=UPI000F8E27A6|nr:hypothetical protein [Legionella sp. km772]RUR06804.1 hypothetical protein ELY15_12855 [Legionella sp. km772]